MISDKREKLIKQLLKDHHEQKLSSFAAMIALRLIVDPKEPTKEFEKFIKTSVELYKDRKKDASISL